jgi:hypothetical protein
LETILPEARDKPSAAADRETRERWILDKYVHKKFAKKEMRSITPTITLTLSLPTPHHSPQFALSPREAILPPRDATLPPRNLAIRLPPGFSEFSAVRPRTPDCIPTSHIGSNVFAKKTPYNSSVANNSPRRGSLASFLATPQHTNVNYSNARRNSMFYPRMM